MAPGALAEPGAAGVHHAVYRRPLPGILASKILVQVRLSEQQSSGFGNLFRVTERKVESSCIHCNKCVEICPFDAIKPDFTTRETDCTLCQTCGGVCPTHAIKFVERWNVVELKVANEPPTQETPIGRRGFLSLARSAAAVVGGVAGAASVKALGARLDDDFVSLPVRPPGSVPEEQFLQMCIRCGECFKVCPNNVLQPEGFEQGLEGLWTPRVEANWAGCK